MEIIMAVLVLLASALGLGIFVELLGMPHIVGEIGAGIIVGPAILNLIGYASALSSLASVALFFIILLIGVEATSEMLTKNLAQAAGLSIASFVVPAVLLFIISYFAFNLPFITCAIISIAIGVPSISVISVLILRYGLLRKRGGQTILASVVFSDISAFIILALIEKVGSKVILIVGIFIFAVALFALDRFMRKHRNRFNSMFASLRKTERGETLAFGLVIVAGLVVSSLLQLIGITYILGAFFAGLLISRAVVGARMFHMFRNTFRRLNNSFFIPIFFSIAGLEVSIISSQYLLLLAILIAVGFISIFLVGYAFAVIEASDMKRMSTIALLGGRGAVGIAIGSIALSSNLINSSIYSVIVLATIGLSMMLPPFLKGQRFVR
jgi:Kef-type K+ transport system membrane component KefB